ncbi:hypothetical protein ABZW49_10540 [Nonomuraea wenchangensis]
MPETPKEAEQAAAILQARMSWPEAERCAASLTCAGWMSLTAPTAAEVLTQHMPPHRALACAQDLVIAGLIKNGERYA